MNITKTYKNKNTNGTVNTPIQVIESITVQPQSMAAINAGVIEIKPLEFKIDNNNLTIEQKQKLIKLVNKKDMYMLHTITI